MQLGLSLQACKRLSFYNRRILWCDDLDCKTPGCRLIYTPDARELLQVVEIPCSIVRGFHDSEVVWNPDTLTGERRSLTTGDKTWYIDCSDNPVGRAKYPSEKGVCGFEVVSENQLLNRIRIHGNYLNRRRSENGNAVKNKELGCSNSIDEVTRVHKYVKSKSHEPLSKLTCGKEECTSMKY